MAKRKRSFQSNWLVSAVWATLVLGFLIFYPADARPAVAFHQDWIEGNYPEIKSSNLDLENIDAVFKLVFSALRDEVIVYPTENYYYFIFKNGDKEVWGNFHLPPADEISDYLDFAYWVFEEDPEKTQQVYSQYRRMGEAEGVSIRKADRLKYGISYGGREAMFNFNDLTQVSPNGFKPHKDEVFVARTFDESGYQLLLFYNQKAPHFFFVLDEDGALPESLTAAGESHLIGERSGFAFYQDGDRKVLFGVNSANVKRNNYYDGPFDQLADNFVADGKLSEFMQRAYQYTKDRIDRYGRFTDLSHSRLAMTPYNFYNDPQELSAIIKGCGGKEFVGCLTYDFKEKSPF